jgi:hypothetical protein
VQGPQNNSKNNPSNPGRRRRRPHGGQRSERAPRENAPREGAEARNRQFQGSARGRRNGRPLSSAQVLVKYDNLLEQHLITRRKYYEYFNRVDDRQLKRLEKNFFDSIEHLRRFENNLEPWQREVLEKRKTERYQLDLTYSQNRGWNPEEMAKVEVSPEEIEDPHFKDTQKEAFEIYRDDTEESEGSYQDYLKAKGLA